MSAKDIKAIALKAEQAVKNLGAKDAHIAVSHRVTHEFNIANGEFSLFRTMFDDSVGLTVFKDNKKGSVGINKTETETQKMPYGKTAQRGENHGDT